MRPKETSVIEAPKVAPAPPQDDQVSRYLGLLRSELPQERDQAARWLIAHAEEAEPRVAAAVRSGDSGNPDVFMRLLAGMGLARSVPALEAALQRGREGESWYAAQALALHPHPDARAALLRGLESGSVETRIGVADALWQPTAGWACEALNRAAQDRDHRARYRIIRAAARAGCLPRDALERIAREDPDEGIRVLARELLNQAR